MTAEGAGATPAASEGAPDAAPQAGAAPAAYSAPTRALLRFAAPPDLPGAQAIIRRDLAMTAARSLADAVTMTLGVQLCLHLGGDAVHASAIHTAAAVGLLASGAYATSSGGTLAPLYRSQILAGLALAATPVAAFVAEPALASTLMAALLGLSAAFAGLSLPLISAAYAKAYPQQLRGSLVAYSRLVHGIVAVACLAVLGRLSRDHLDLTWLAYPLVGLLGAVTARDFCRLPLEVSTSRPPVRVMLATLVRDRGFRRFQGFQFLLGLGNLMANPLLAVYAHAALGLPVAIAVWIVPNGIVEHAMRLATVRLHGRLYDRLGVFAHRTITDFVFAMGLACWAFADSMGPAIAGSLLLGFGRAGGQIIWTIGSLEFAPKGAEQLYAATHTLLTGVRGIFAPALGLWLLTDVFDGSYRNILFLCAGLAAAATLGHGLPSRHEVESGPTPPSGSASTPPS